MAVIIGIMSARDKQQPRSRSKETRTQQFAKYIYY